jgi:hypothetical protein
MREKKRELMIRLIDSAVARIWQYSTAIRPKRSIALRLKRGGVQLSLADVFVPLQDLLHGFLILEIKESSDENEATLS